MTYIVLRDVQLMSPAHNQDIFSFMANFHQTWANISDTHLADYRGKRSCLTHKTGTALSEEIQSLIHKDCSGLSMSDYTTHYKTSHD